MGHTVYRYPVVHGWSLFPEKERWGGASAVKMVQGHHMCLFGIGNWTLSLAATITVRLPFLSTGDRETTCYRTVGFHSSFSLKLSNFILGIYTNCNLQMSLLKSVKCT